MRSSTRAYAAGASKNLIRVAVGPVMYALKVSRIREIVNPLPVIDLPREQEFVLGVSDYRDEVVVVVDLRSLFGLEHQAPTRKSKWIILESDHRLVGVVVDSVLDVFSSADRSERVVPALDERHEQRGIRSAYKYGDDLVFLLDADRLAEPALRLEHDELSLLPSGAP